MTVWGHPAASTDPQIQPFARLRWRDRGRCWGHLPRRSTRALSTQGPKMLLRGRCGCCSLAPGLWFGILASCVTLDRRVSAPRAQEVSPAQPQKGFQAQEEKRGLAPCHFRPHLLQVKPFRAVGEVTPLLVLPQHFGQSGSCW